MPRFRVDFIVEHWYRATVEAKSRDDLFDVIAHDYYPNMSPAQARDNFDQFVTEVQSDDAKQLADWDWELVKHIPEGHRYYLDHGNNHTDDAGQPLLYIADESGETPEDTDDGLLVVDRNKLEGEGILFVKWSNGGTRFSCYLSLRETNLAGELGDETSTPINFAEARWLCDYFGLRMEDRHGVIYAPGMEKPCL